MSTSPLIDRLEPRRLLANVIIDPTFGASGYTAGGAVESFIGLSGDGVMTKLTVERNDSTSYHYRRYLASGLPDPAFTPIKQAGYSSWRVATDLVGRLIVAESADNGGITLTRYSLTGALDKAFGKNGVSTFLPTGVQANDFSDSDILSVAAGPDNSVFILTDISQVANPSVRYSVVKVNPSGSVDTSFGENGTADVGQYKSSFFDEGRLLVDSLGRPHAIVPANESYANPKLVRRLTTAGQLDKSFAAVAIPDGYDDTVSLDAKGRVLFGIQTTIGGQSQFQVTRFNDAGRRDQTFGVAGVATPFAKINYGDLAIVSLADGTVEVQSGDQLGRLDEQGQLVRRSAAEAPKSTYIRAMGRDGRFIADAELGLFSDSVTRLVATPFAYVSKNGTLTMVGSNGDDAFSLRPSGPAGRVLVGYNGTRLGLFNGVKSISLALDDGDDAVAARTITQPMAVTGGEGDDSIATGLATDAIDLGAGNNAVDAGPGGGVIKAVWQGITPKQPYLNIISAPGLARDRWKIDIAYGRTRINATGRTATVAMGSHSSVAVLNFTSGVTVYGTAGNDSILTGAGNDKIVPGGGRDTVDTDAGDDLIDGSSRAALTADDDRYVLGPGNDLVFDLFGRSTILGGDGDDTATIGTAGDDLSSVEHVTRKTA